MITGGVPRDGLVVFPLGLRHVVRGEQIVISAVCWIDALRCLDPLTETVDKGDMVQRRWSWPGQNKRPVYNFRSEGREFKSNRCLIVADGFCLC